MENGTSQDGMVQVGIRMPSDMREALEVIAEKEDRSLSRTIVRLLRQALDSQRVSMSQE